MKEYELADVRFNNGGGALLCNECLIIIADGFEHEDRVHLCEECLLKREREAVKKMFDILDGEKHTRYDEYYVAGLKARISELEEALEEAVYLLHPTDDDMQKKAGVYRVVSALEKLKEKNT